MKKKQTQIRQYAKIMSVFLVAVVIGLLIFFYCIQRSVEHRSQKMIFDIIISIFYPKVLSKAKKSDI